MLDGWEVRSYTSIPSLLQLGIHGVYVKLSIMKIKKNVPYEVEHQFIPISNYIDYPD